MISDSTPHGAESPIKISVIMIDGGFRENIFGADYFSRQDFPDNQYEVIWVEYFSRPHEGLSRFPKVDVQTLGREGIYHSSLCFNHGIARARGELVVIPDADQIVPPDFLSRAWDLSRHYEKLVIYGYRHDEVEAGSLGSHDFAELEENCLLKNPTNYGGCLVVAKKWLLEVNGYEQHPIFRTGNHANGLDMYTRFKNIGLAVQWEPTLKLYHPWHPFTLQRTTEHDAQEKLIQWRKMQRQWIAFQGIDPARNSFPPEKIQRMLDRTLRRLERQHESEGEGKLEGAGDAEGRGSPVAVRRGLLARLLGGRRSSRVE